jgi:hypothetical protein
MRLTAGGAPVAMKCRTMNWITKVRNALQLSWWFLMIMCRILYLLCYECCLCGGLHGTDTVAVLALCTLLSRNTKRSVRMHVTRDENVLHHQSLQINRTYKVSSPCLPADEQSNTDSWVNYCSLKRGFLALPLPLVLWCVPL